MTNRFSKLVQEFLTTYIIGECNYSVNTRNSYSTTFHLLLEFMNAEKNIKPNKIEIETITKEVIVQFLNWLETNRNVSISTRNQRLACIKSFYKYVQSNEPDLFDTCVLILSIKNKKVPNKMISYFSEDEIKIMINYLNNSKDLKKLTMICVLYETGARVSEFINIKLSDLNLSDNANITLYGKGNKTRIVPISQELINLINKYLKEVYINYGNDYLFYSNYKKKYNRKSINYLINNIVNNLKNNYVNYFKGNYHPHSFRHTKATHLYNNGTPLLYVKEFLGHSTISSTEIYATPDSKKQREEILKNSESINTKNKYSNNKKDDLDNWLKNNMK
ncbi:MAG: tyrosine-type recombinase/integrase [Bacilli bacterium]|nr:tyrosine-type recombinase/integrase [Bacilli bacterium]